MAFLVPLEFNTEAWDPMDGEGEAASELDSQSWPMSSMASNTSRTPFFPHPSATFALSSFFVSLLGLLAFGAPKWAMTS